ncbi:MAG: RNA methyltransferase [Snowella sp.]|nr:RNA methyltransferase [Snowella sp.]
MITSSQNPLVKQIRKLHRSKGRREQNLLLLEGTHLLETAWQGDCSFQTVCYTPQWQERYSQLLERVIPRSQRIECVSPEVLQQLATTVNPDGVIATIERDFQTISRSNSLQLGLILERIQDPGNLGTIIRSAVATQVDQLWLSEDSVELDNPKVLRSSAGAWFHLSKQSHPDLGQLIKNYQAQGIQVIATRLDAAKTFWEIDFIQPSLILLGNEGAGLSPELSELADESVTIPLAPGVESLNVAIAAALLLYEAQRQKQTQTR